MISPTPVTFREILRTWLPLAGSWMLMGLEMPLVVAAASRLANVEPNLAAFASVVYPLSMVVEGPIIMLLAASTALAVDRRSYRWLERFTVRAAVLLTIVHALFAFTPAYDWVATELIEVSADALEPGRLGFRIMLPWSAAIAYRRFQQGVLIRHGHADSVMQGTAIRLLVNVSALIAGVAHGGFDGIVVGAAAIAAGVIAEAVFATIKARPVANRLPEVADGAEPLTGRRFTRFYAPLALTPLIALATPPLTAGALWRMSEPEASAASWGAIYGFVFLFRALGFAFQEVTVSITARPGGPAALRRFALVLAVVATVVYGLVSATPLIGLWLDTALELPEHLAALGRMALPIGIALPALSVCLNWLQGRLVAAHRTRGITEAVVIYLGTLCLGFWVAVEKWQGPGAGAALLVLTLAGVVQLGWLLLRCRLERA